MSVRRESMMTALRPHPDHFDAKKFGADGKRVRPNGQRCQNGRTSPLKLEDVEQVLFLAELVRAASRDLANFLAETGIHSKYSQRRIVQALRRGWRPKR